jgi:hypothetical protein
MDRRRASSMRINPDTGCATTRAAFPTGSPSSRRGWRRTRCASRDAGCDTGTRRSRTSCSGSAATPRNRREQRLGTSDRFTSRPRRRQPARRAGPRAIADVAARLIAEHGIADWSLAKRKALRQLLLPDGTALPGDDEIEARSSSITRCSAATRMRSRCAISARKRSRWLRALAEFSPMLVGGVAAGWATEHSDIRIELIADDSKEVELMLINRNIPYRVAPGSSQHGATTELYVDTRRGGVALVIRTPAVARQRPRRDRRGNDDVRLNATALAELLARGAS